LYRLTVIEPSRLNRLLALTTTVRSLTVLAATLVV
jgi:hypothetical protein